VILFLRRHAACVWLALLGVAALVADLVSGAF